jgi:hypothetical protein
MVFGEPSNRTRVSEPSRASIVVLAGLLLFSVILGTVMPGMLYEFLQKVVLVLQG